MPRRSSLPSVLAVLALLAVAGCSFTSPPTATTIALEKHAAEQRTLLHPKQPGAPTLDVQAKIDPAYVRTAYSVKAGVVNISFTSPIGSNHNMNLVGPGVTDPLQWGEDAGAPESHLTYSVTLRPGVYTFYCSVLGHRAVGMEGHITVT